MDDAASTLAPDGLRDLAAAHVTLALERRTMTGLPTAPGTMGAAQVHWLVKHTAWAVRRAGGGPHGPFRAQAGLPKGARADGGQPLRLAGQGHTISTPCLEAAP